MTDGDEKSEGAVFSYDVSSSESLSEGVIAAVSTVTGVAPVATALVPDAEVVQELDPLYRAVNPDALDSIFRAAGRVTTPVSGWVSFFYHGHEVTVHSDGRIFVERREAATDD
jgi:hypothetical protein